MSLNMLPLELISMIFDEVFDFSDLACLARVCRRYESIALKLLWEDISDIEPLLSVVPALRTIIEQPQDVQQAIASDASPNIPPETNWERFNKYRQLIRSLEVTQREDFDYGLVSRVAECTTPPLLPRLIKFQYHHRDDEIMTGEMVSIVSNFMTASIRDLQIDGPLYPAPPPGQEEHDILPSYDPILAMFFHSLPDRVKDLRVLHMSGNMPSVPLDFIGRFRNLTHFDITNVYMRESPIDRDFLHALIGLDALKSLNFSPSTILPEDVSGWSAPPALESIVIYQTTNVKTITAITSRLPLTLVTFSVSGGLFALGGEDSVTPADVQAMCSELSRFRVTLRSLTLCVRLIHPEEGYDGPTTMTMIHPLLELHELRELTLSTHNGHPIVAFTDPDIDRMVSAWPNLDYLSLPQTIPALGVQSLVSIAQRCPNLQTLHLFDVDVPATLDIESITVLPNTSVERLIMDLPRSTDPSAIIFAQVLHRLFPRIRGVHEHDDEDSEGEISMDEDDAEGLESGISANEDESDRESQ